MIGYLQSHFNLCRRGPCHGTADAGQPARRRIWHLEDVRAFPFTLLEISHDYLTRPDRIVGRGFLPQHDTSGLGSHTSTCTSVLLFISAPALSPSSPQMSISPTPDCSSGTRSVDSQGRWTTDVLTKCNMRYGHDRAGHSHQARVYSQARLRQDGHPESAGYDLGEEPPGTC